MATKRPNETNPASPPATRPKTKPADAPIARTEAIACISCGSTKRKRYHRTSPEIPYRGVSPLTGVICRAYIDRWCNCANCDQIRRERMYIPADVLDHPAESQAAAARAAASAIANGQTPRI